MMYYVTTCTNMMYYVTYYMYSCCVSFLHVLMWCVLHISQGVYDITTHAHLVLCYHMYSCGVLFATCTNVTHLNIHTRVLVLTEVDVEAEEVSQ